MMSIKAEGYANLLQEHIWKENNILYPMAEEALILDAKKIMSGKFAEAEQKLADEIKKQIAFLDKLA